METLKRTATGFFWNQIGRTLEYLLVYIFSVLIARQLGAEINGIYATILSFIFLLLTVSSFGLETSIAATFPRAYKTLPEAASAFRGLLFFRIIFSLLVAFAFLSFRNFIVHIINIPASVHDYIFVVVFYFILRSLISLFSSTLIAFFKTKINSVLAVTTRIVELVGVYLLISEGLGLKHIFSLVAATSILQLLAYVILFREILFLKIKFVTIKPTVILGAKFWVNSMLEFFLGKQISIILLGIFFITHSDIGSFDVAFTFAQVINTGLTLGFFGVSIAAFSSLDTKSDMQIKKFTESVVRFVILLVTPFLFFAGFFAQSIIPFIYSYEYNNSIFLFQVFVGTIIISRIIGGGITADYLYSKGETKKLIIASITGGLVNIIFSIILIPIYGIIGASIALLTAILTTTIIHLVYVRRAISINIQYGFGFSILLICLISALISSFVADVLHLTSPIFVLIIYVISVLFISSLVKPIHFVDLNNLLHINKSLYKVASFFSKDEYFNAGITDRQKWAYAWMPESNCVIDIGCSNTALVQLLSKKSKFPIGIDIDINTLKSIGENTPKLNLINARAESLPIKNETADVVLLLDVLEHTDDEKMVISEIYRVLKPNGVLIMSVPFKGMFSFLDPQNLSQRIKQGEKNVVHRHYSDKEIRRLFFKLFEIEKKHYGGLFLYPLSFWAGHFFKNRLNIDLSNFFRWIGDIDNDISWGRLSYNLIIKARKI